MSMRISTNTLFETGAGRIGDLQSRLAKLQEQISLGKRVLTPSDDPISAAQALELSQAQSINAQFATNRTAAKNALNLEEHVLQSVTKLIQDAQTTAVNAGNGSLDDEQRKYLATELKGRLEDLFGLANTRDAEGNYVFGGYRVSEVPFLKVPGGATYEGDQGQRLIQVGPSRKLEINDSGSAIFEKIKTGTGVVTTIARGDNAGSGVIVNGTATAAITHHSYRIEFDTPTTYVVHDLTASTTSAPQPFVAGDAITVGEYKVSITGTPAVTDTFDVQPSKNQSLFNTLAGLVEALGQSAGDATGKARLSNNLNTAINNLGNALDNVLTTRASVGSRLRELEALDEQGDERDTLYAKSLQELTELDYTKAITDLSKQKIMLDAAQQAFVKTSGMSLFNYMS
ncbi:MAG TPA: flagellar hook-associated protein FlgL [Noviherbaspirillum sp.]|jgi:flagellar hook-associated protein 3 FlgL|uniref:flagellar hook-associated protein FlgL n=1 Tax=Noviherbaspirillum sp. TaxID=1926288 RepID=UPI002F9376D5